MSANQIIVPIATRVGVFLAHYSAQGLARLEFPRRDESKRLALAARRTLPAPLCRWHRLSVRAVVCVLAGKAAADLPPLDLSAGTLFQRNVWGALRRILPGKTLTYAQVARAIGKLKATRAVGGACGANPIPLLIPCHRVLRTDGQLGGFSAGLKWKRLLLEQESGRPSVGTE